MPSLPSCNALARNPLATTGARTRVAFAIVMPLMLVTPLRAAEDTDLGLTSRLTLQVADRAFALEHPSGADLDTDADLAFRAVAEARLATPRLALGLGVSFDRLDYAEGADDLTATHIGVVLDPIIRQRLGASRWGFALGVSAEAGLARLDYRSPGLSLEDERGPYAQILPHADLTWRGDGFALGVQGGYRWLTSRYEIDGEDLDLTADGVVIGLACTFHR
ncbi:MAG: hypothetical protein ACOCYV_00645 [Planctomycetota bacterium]